MSIAVDGANGHPLDLEPILDEREEGEEELGEFEDLGSEGEEDGEREAEEDAEHDAAEDDLDDDDYAAEDEH